MLSPLKFIRKILKTQKREHKIIEFCLNSKRLNLKNSWFMSYLNSEIKWENSSVINPDKKPKES